MSCRCCLAVSCHVVRVFVSADGRGGNRLGVCLDGGAVPPARRLGIARELGFSETVFVDRVGPGDAATIAIFAPARELGFAGHPTVGTAWLLRQLGSGVGRLLVPAGEVTTWEDGPLTWIRAWASWVHPMTIAEHADAAAVEALSGAPAGHDSYYAWAWVDAAAGVVRSRYFAPAIGVAEDEATGAAAIVLGDRLGRPLLIRQGIGSELHVRPNPEGSVEVGGRVVDEGVIAGPRPAC